MRRLLICAVLVLCLIPITDRAFADLMEKPLSITVDNNGYIYVVCGRGTWRYELRKYDRDGKLIGVLNTKILSLWASDFKKDIKAERGGIRDKIIQLADYLKSGLDIETMLQKMIYPRLIAINRDSHICVVGDDISAESYKLGILDSNDGHPIEVFDIGGTGEKEISYPSGIAVDLEGNFYITNNWDNKVKIYSKKGEFLYSFGGKGTADGLFKTICAIAIDDRKGYAYVTDNYIPRWTGDQPYQMRVQKFTKEGRYLLKWGKNEFLGFNIFPPMRLEGPKLHGPAGIAVDSKGNVYVLCSYTAEIKKFTGEGKPILKWGRRGSGAGEFKDPQAIAIDKDDNIYVADTDNNRLQKFDSNGKFLMEIK